MTQKETLKLERDKDGFIVGEVGGLSVYLPFEIHDNLNDSWHLIEDGSALQDWSGDIDMHPRYDEIMYDKDKYDYNEKCRKYRAIFDGWENLTPSQRRDRINNFRCGL